MNSAEINNAFEDDEIEVEEDQGQANQLLQIPKPTAHETDAWGRPLNMVTASTEMTTATTASSAAPTSRRTGGTLTATGTRTATATATAPSTNPYVYGDDEDADYLMGLGVQPATEMSAPPIEQ